jgi:hypothetical protein
MNSPESTDLSRDDVMPRLRELRRGALVGVAPAGDALVVAPTEAVAFDESDTSVFLAVDEEERSDQLAPRPATLVLQTDHHMVIVVGSIDPGEAAEDCPVADPYGRVIIRFRPERGRLCSRFSYPPRGDRVEQAGLDSFPASDPPSFTPERL